MVKDPHVFLAHIIEAVGLIESYVAGVTFEQFEHDTKTRDAVIRQLEIIGEAVSNLEQDFRSEYAEIPWREISDFRNVLAHEYWDIDIEIVWKAATEEAPELKKAIIHIIPNSEINP